MNYTANWPRLSWVQKSVIKKTYNNNKKTQKTTDGVLHVETLRPGQFSSIWLQPPGCTGTYFIQSVLQHWWKHVSLNRWSHLLQNQDPSMARETDKALLPMLQLQLQACAGHQFPGLADARVCCLSIRLSPIWNVCLSIFWLSTTIRNIFYIMIQYTVHTEVIFQIFNNQCVTGIHLSE